MCAPHAKNNPLIIELKLYIALIFLLIIMQDIFFPNWGRQLLVSWSSFFFLEKKEDHGLIRKNTNNNKDM